MLVFSVLLHLFVVVYISGTLFEKRVEERRVSYKVNLVNRPVEKPRHGRPDASPVKKSIPRVKPKPQIRKPAVQPQAKPAPVKKVVLPPQKTQVQQKVEKKKIEPQKKKTATKPVRVEKQKPQAEIVQPQQPMLSAAEIERLYQQDTQKRIEEIRRENATQDKIARLKKQLSSLAAEESPAPVTVRARQLGSVTGTGVQVGVDMREWIKEYLSENWTLPKTYWKRGLKARVEIFFDAQGYQSSYKMLDASGDIYFDDSVRQAVMRLQKLPAAPTQKRSYTITFDPEEML